MSNRRGKGEEDRRNTIKEVVYHYCDGSLTEGKSRKRQVKEEGERGGIRENDRLS